MNGCGAVLEIVYSLRDFLFPPSCLSCEGEITGDGLLCSDCFDMFTAAAFKYKPPQRTIEHVTHYSVLLPYDSACRTIVHSLKYHGMPSIGIIFGKLLAQKTLAEHTLSENTILVPVPLHPSRLKDRGYNQSERIAQGFAAFSGYTLTSDILKRTRNTGTQTALDHGERSQNVSNAFMYSGEKHLSGTDVVLFDDVMTTGSTIEACALALKNGGAGKITVCVLATPDVGNE
ncbi:MAG: ComF family protein [Candidatus Latescibacteria bacterium]|nr:ComF family protein [Candidatus Latescibacterota bacterium]